MTEPLTSLPLNLPISQPQPLDLLLTCLLGNNREPLTFLLSNLPVSQTQRLDRFLGSHIFLLSLPRKPMHPRQPGMPCPPPERPRESPSTVLPNFHGECPQHPLPPGLPHLPFRKPRLKPSSRQLSLPGGHSCHHVITLRLY